MPARRKIPLVWKTKKESEQTLFKYNATTQRVVRIGCTCPPPPPEPVCTPPAYVTLSISGNDLVIIFPSGILMINYDGYLVNVTDGVDVALVLGNLNVGGTYTVPNGATGLTPGKQYKIRLVCTGTGDPACNFIVNSNIITA